MMAFDRSLKAAELQRATAQRAKTAHPHHTDTRYTYTLVAAKQKPLWEENIIQSDKSLKTCQGHLKSF